MPSMLFGKLDRKIDARRGDLRAVNSRYHVICRLDPTWGAKVHPLLGTWRLKSYVVTAGTGETSMPYGADPIGYLSYSADGRMQAIGTSRERVVPSDPALTTEQRSALYQTMFAYAGTFSVEPGKVTHHVDVSWNEAWNGTDQERFFQIKENTLTLRSRAVDPSSGIAAEYVVLWEKVTSPH